MADAAPKMARPEGQSPMLEHQTLFESAGRVEEEGDFPDSHDSRCTLKSEAGMFRSRKVEKVGMYSYRA